MSRTVDSGRPINLLAVHHQDVDVSAMLSHVSSWTRAGDAADHLRLVIHDQMPNDPARWDVTSVTSEGEYPGGRLLDRLADAGSVSRLRTVALCSLVGDRSAAIDMDESLGKLQDTLSGLLSVERARTHARIAIVGYGEELLHPRFFSALANANLIVIPYDRFEDSGVARPVERAAQEVFHWHGATEILAATGLVPGDGSAVVDRLAHSVGASTGVQVRFVHSRVRVLRTEALPVHSILAEERELPLPDGFVPGQVGPGVVDEMVKEVMPSELRYQANLVPDPNRRPIDLGTLLLSLLRDLGASVVELPSMLWRAAAGEFTSVTRGALERALGPDSRLKIRSTDPGLTSFENDGDVLSFIPADIEDDSAPAPKVRHNPIPSYVWTNLVSETLGLVDGDPDCRELRERVFGSHLMLANQRQLLLPGAEGLADLRATLADPDVAASPESPSGEEGPSQESIDVYGAAEHEATRAIREAWPEIIRDLGAVRLRAQQTYRDADPHALAGGVLSLRFEGPRSEETLRRCRDEQVHLSSAVEQSLGRTIRHFEVLFGSDADDWRPTVRVDLLARAAGRAVDEVLNVLGRLAIEVEDEADVLEPAQVDRYLAEQASSLVYRRGDDNEYFGFYPPVVAPAAASTASHSRSMQDDGHESLDDGESPGVLASVANDIETEADRASADRSRIEAVLDETVSGESSLLAISPAVPLAAILGLGLLLFVLGVSDIGGTVIDSLEITGIRQEILFLSSSLIIIVAAMLLSDVGNRLGVQARIITLGAFTVAVLSAGALLYQDIRSVLPPVLVQGRWFAGLLALGVVLSVFSTIAQARRSGDLLRLRAARVLVVPLAVYLLLAAVFWQKSPGALLQQLPQPTQQRLFTIIVATGLALLVLSLAVMATVRFRLERELQRRREVLEWALRELVRTEDVSQRLRAASLQWRLTAVMVAQLLRFPFGPLWNEQDSRPSHVSPVLKNRGVLLELGARARADLESRIRLQLITPSWLRMRYESLVVSFQETLAARNGVQVRELKERRPESDETVPVLADLAEGRVRGDRATLAVDLLHGRHDEALASAINELDVSSLLASILSDPSVEIFDAVVGRSRAVVRFFGEVLPHSDPLLVPGLVDTVLAAQDRRNRFTTHVWWPTGLFGPPPAEGIRSDTLVTETPSVRHGPVGGVSVIALRVDVSEEFSYRECAGAVVDSASVSEQTTKSGHVGLDDLYDL